MTRTQFRLLLIASVVAGLLSGFIDLLAPSLVPDAYQAAQRLENGARSLTRLLLCLALGLVGAMLSLAAVYGLYRFRSWAPRIGVAGTALLLLACSLMDTFVQSGVAAALSTLASYLWGAVLVLGYVPSFKDQFARYADFQRSPSSDAQQVS